MKKLEDKFFVDEILLYRHVAMSKIKKNKEFYKIIQEQNLNQKI